MDKREIVGIGPLSPPITGPGIKNKHVKQGLEEAGISVVWVNTLQRSPSTIIKLIREIKNGDHFLVSASTKVRFGTALLLSRRLQSSNVHAALLPAGGAMATEIQQLPSSLQERYLDWFGRFDCIMPESDELATNLSNLFGDSLCVSTLPNLRPVPEHPPDFDSFADGNRPLRLVYVGRIKKTKGLDYLLEAVNVINEPSEQVTLDVFGHFLEGDEYKEQFIRNCTATRGASFVGKIEDGGVIRTLRGYDCFVFPTYYPGEGFPGVLIEAFAGGCLVVASDWNYNSELIDVGDNGVLFQPKDTADLRNKIETLLDNPEMVDRYKWNAWETADEYSIERVTNDLLTHLERHDW